MRLRLKAGEWVEVRSKKEILATLDEHGRLAGLPFMPEMFQHCGQRLRVFKRAHKTCDTIGPSKGRKMTEAVHLEGIRCGGDAHGGCQASCMIFWKEAWLKRAPGPQTAAANAEANDALPAGCAAAPVRCSEQTVIEETEARSSVPGGDPGYRCQATELQKATEPLPWWHITQYLEDYTSGNVTLREIMASGLHSAWYHLSEAGIGVGSVMRWLYDKLQAFRGGVPFPWRRGTVPPGVRTPSAVLNLQPGEWVRVKSYQEILSTLDRNNRNRGLFFGPEEVPYCGGTYQVVQRVNRIIDEKTGKMLNLKDPAVVLDGVYCHARYCEDRKFCPRAIFTYWRDVWLEKPERPPRTREGDAAGSPLRC